MMQQVHDKTWLFKLKYVIPPTPKKKLKFVAKLAKNKIDMISSAYL